MNRTKLALFNVVIAYVIAAYFIYENNQLTEGLGSCIENVQSVCGPVTTYAISLENENARLNRKLAACICPEKLD